MTKKAHAVRAYLSDAGFDCLTKLTEREPDGNRSCAAERAILLQFYAWEEVEQIMSQRPKVGKRAKQKGE